MLLRFPRMPSSNCKLILSITLYSFFSFKWNPYETFHCSLSLADGDGQLEDGKLPVDRQQSFLSDEEAETENEEDEEDNNGTEEESGESDAECSDGSAEEEDLEGDDENEPWNWKEKNLIEVFGDLNVPAGYDDDDSF